MIHEQHVKQTFEPEDTRILVACNSVQQGNVFTEVVTERTYQDTLWGPAYERDNMTEADWVRVIGEYSRGEGRAEKYDFKTRMIKVAALAVAAREWQVRG